MDATVLIVTKNRPEELRFTLDKLKNVLDLSIHEVRVLIDGCVATKGLIALYPWVHWEYEAKSIGASPARNRLYSVAKGAIFIGLDDDAHPLHKNFIQEVEAIFNADTSIGIVAFQEIRGLFESDALALENASLKVDKYYTNDFVGCGFAVKRSVYEQTNGFPIWMDIYGEESCVGIEIMDLGYTIYYDNSIAVNHRINRLQRQSQGRNYFRFEKQLTNSIFYYWVYYKNPHYKVAKLLFHNFKKYGLHNLKYFLLFWKVFFVALVKIRYVWQFRKPVQKETLTRMSTYRGISY